MLRLIKRTKRNVKREEPAGFFRVVFALAVALKVTPKRLSNSLDKEKTDPFAKKFREEIRKRIDKSLADARKLAEKYNTKEKNVK